MNTAERTQLQESEPAPVEQSVAGMLAAARHAQSLSVTDIANRLKLSVQQVEALEQGAYDRLPGPVFVRGFTRNYARLLKLDVEAVMRALDVQLPRQAAEQAAPGGEANIPMPAKSGGRWPVIAGVAAVVFLGAALVDVLWPETPSTKTVAPTEAPAPATAPEPEVAVTPAPVAPSPAAVPAVEQAPAAMAAIGEPAASAAAVPATYRQNPAGARTVKLTFDQKSWVQVRDGSGTVVLEALYEPGSSREITARPPLALVIGNAAGVRLTYDDRTVDLVPHTREAVARLALK